jgi:NAD(P)-dependent dehydrogenase (short-subunit alcohol dehydrogenase family)
MSATLKKILGEFFSIEGNVAIVCGGGSGLGRAICRGFGEAGAKVVIFDVRDPKEVAEEVKQTGADVATFVVDVTNRTSIESAVEKVIDRFGRIDVLINTAGISPFAPAEQETPEQFKRTLDINLVGMFNTCTIIGRQMIKQRSGKIVNFGSIDGLTVFPGSVSYNTSKAGVHHLTRTLAVEWIKYGVNVNAVAPTIFNTPMNTELLKKKEFMREYLKHYVPLGRIGEPREILGTIIFLCSRASDMYVGAIMDVNGGSAINGGWQN